MRRSIPWIFAGLFALLWASSAYQLSLMRAPLRDVARSIEEVHKTRAAERQSTADSVVRALRLIRSGQADAAIVELEALLPGLSYSLELAADRAGDTERTDLVRGYLEEFPPAEPPSDHILSGANLPVYDRRDDRPLLQRSRPAVPLLNRVHIRR
jgi:hypothetical protein